MHKEVSVNLTFFKITPVHQSRDNPGSRCAIIRLFSDIQVPDVAEMLIVKWLLRVLYTFQSTPHTVRTKHGVFILNRLCPDKSEFSDRSY
jgi:hypothetical protein